MECDSEDNMNRFVFLLKLLPVLARYFYSSHYCSNHLEIVQDLRNDHEFCAEKGTGIFHSMEK